MSSFEKLLEEYKLIKIKVDNNLIKKELESSEYDSEKSKEDLKNEDFKWATIKAYYSIFHSMRALIYSKGYREKSHYALSIAIKHLFIDENLLDKKFLNYLLEAMDLREDADYNMIFSQDSAVEVIKMAEESLAEIKKILNL